MAEYINVTSLNRLAKQVLAQCEPLNNLIVLGEISGFKRHTSGHLYFTLKDEAASVKSVMFRGSARTLGFFPENGMQVLAYGHAAIYERDGSFQFYVDFMRPFGAGAAQLAFDRLYKKLEAEGLFDPSRKTKLPAVPRCIGIVTSKTGAALQDVIHVLGRRWPMVRLLLAPVTVQGLEAEHGIAAAIRALDADPRPDLILVTRGGGSKEDLWVFNSELIARTAAGCRKPVVSAVGHEIDTTILDYVADLRAPTPSAAAELCVPDKAELEREIFILRQNIQKNIQSRLKMCYNEYKGLAAVQSLRREYRLVQERERDLAQLGDTLQNVLHDKVGSAQNRLQAAAALAAGLNPYAVLARGYAMVADEEGNALTISQLTPGQKIRLRGDDSTATCTVDDVSMKEEGSI